MPSHALHTLATVLVAVPAVLLVVSQCRRPRWALGRLFIWLMNRTHARVTAWGLGHVTIGSDAHILDVGCGGGRTIRTLAGMGRSVHGIDYSATCAAVAKASNADLIAQGRVFVQQASVSALPYPDASFDLVTAVETHYYWPELTKDLQEVLRVLKPRGTLVLIAETYKGERFGALLMIPMLMLRARYLTLGEHRALLHAAGFTDIIVDHDPRRGWICAVARRSAALAA